MPEENKNRFVMVRIPAGEFVMGSRQGQGETDEFPPHTVMVDEFIIGRFPVTAAQWARFLNDAGNPNEEYFESSSETTVVLVRGKYHPRQNCSDYPANGVTWNGAMSFCDWMTQKTKHRFRLPTEAEWEKAARGGLEGARFPWGNESPLGLAHYNLVWSDPRHTLCPVGSYPPNPYGLYDMAGLVWEWCSDWYGRNWYHDSPHQNPTGPESGQMKILRGGSWGGLDVQVRCGIRVGEFPNISESRVGFRIARTP